MKKKTMPKAVIFIVIIVLVMAMSVMARLGAAVYLEPYLQADRYDPEEGLPFLTEMDSYYHLRMTEDIDNYGHPGEAILGDENWDDLSYAPEGRSAADYRPLMSYITILAYRFFSLFTDDIFLYRIAYYLGAFLSALVVIPVFLLAERLGGTVAGCAAAVLSAINYGYFIHTVPGFYDTDMLISFASCFFLLFGVLFAESAGKALGSKNKTSLIKPAIFGVLLVASLILLYLSWNAYSLYIGIFAAALVLYAVLAMAHSNQGKETAKKSGIMAAIAFVITVLTVLIVDPGIAGDIISYGGSVFAGDSSLFPDAYVSVSEMRKPSLIAGGFSGLFQMKVLSETNIGIINAVGGGLAFLAAFAVFVMLIISVVKKKFDLQYILMIVWFPVTAVLALRSWRFIVLFAVPVAIMTGAFIGRVWNRMVEIKLKDRQIFLGMIAVVLLFPAIYGTYRSVADSFPVIDSGLNESITYLRDNTPEDAIIASWWDYGYYYEQKAKRRTVFDGGSQNGMRVFWMGRALATEDEQLSANILRMVSGSGDTATERMLETFGEDSDTLTLMLDILSAGKSEGESLLQAQGIDAAVSAQLLDLLFPDVTSPVYLLVTQDMTGICGWFSQFGYWNEQKDTGSSDFRVYMNGTTFNPNEEKIAWRMEGNGQPVNFLLMRDGDSFRAFTTGEDMPSGEDSLWDTYGDIDQPLHVEKVLVRSMGNIETFEMEGAAADGMEYSVFIDMDRSEPTISFMTSKVMDSVFGRMHYLEGEGLSCYEKDQAAEGSAGIYCLNIPNN